MSFTKYIRIPFFGSMKIELIKGPVNTKPLPANKYRYNQREDTLLAFQRYYIRDPYKKYIYRLVVGRLEILIYKK